MTSLVVVDGGGTVVEYITAIEETLQETEHDGDEGVVEIEGEEFPAVIVEQVPSTELDQCYAAQVLVYDDQTYLMAEEQEVETVEVEVGTVEASVHGGGGSVCLDKTIEAAEALLHMDSPASLRGDRSPVDEFRPDVLSEMEVEVSTEDSEPIEEELTLYQEETETETQRKKKAGRKPKSQHPYRDGSPELSFKRKPRDCKGSTTYLWEFLLAMLQDKNTCPRYIKWTQREKGIFKLVDSKAVSKLWGKHKNKPDMNYETMGRALRYYYQRGILAKVEGQRLVYQFKEMPKDIVFIDDDKTDEAESDPASDHVTPAANPSILRVSGSGLAQGKAKPSAMPRIINVSSGAEALISLQQSPVSTATMPRTVRVAMQVPIIMSTSGQKISAINSSSVVARGTNAAPKIMYQTLPTLVPATGENGEKITIQLITIPASQLSQLQQPKAHMLGTPITLRTLAPISMAAQGTQVVRLALPQRPGIATATGAGIALARSVQDIRIIKVEVPEPSISETVYSETPTTYTVQMDPPAAEVHTAQS